MTDETLNELSDNEKYQKIQSLREMISSAEKTIQGAKAMLLQIEGKKKSGRRRKMEEETDGTVVQGTFDGQLMIGADGKQYPVPANYASKSKLVEGDMLKLTITSDGLFVYKQIGPAERKNAIGVVSQDENGNYYVVADGKPYKVLLASVTYFKAEPGDEVAIVLSKNIDSAWAAIENVVEKSRHANSISPKMKSSSLQDEIGPLVLEEKPADKKPDAHQSMIIDEWTSDIEEIKKEIEAEKANSSAKE